MFLAFNASFTFQNAVQDFVIKHLKKIASLLDDATDESVCNFRIRFVEQGFEQVFKETKWN